MKKINFTWLTNHACNYRCSYCFQTGHWHEYKKTDKNFSRDSIIAAWERIRTVYGESHICISGGEPTLYPHFIDLVKEISKMHTIGICTNLSLDVKEIIDNLDPCRVDLSISYHPHFSKLNDMLDKLNLLKSRHWPIQVKAVGWPPLIPELEHYRSIFKEFNFSVLPFWGSYNGRDYPMDYSEDEQYVVSQVIAKRENEDFRTAPPSVLGRVCHAGQVYVHIEPDGRVLRCSSGGERIHKNFYDGTFSLLKDASFCRSEYCRCLEWVVCE